MFKFWKSASYVLALMLAVGTAFVVRHYTRRPALIPQLPPSVSQANSESSQPAIAPPPRRVIDRQAVISKAFGTASGRLNIAEKEFEKESRKLATKHLGAIDDFIKSREDGIKPFAERLLSLRGKWVFVRGAVIEKNEHTKFIEEEFGKNIFKPEELMDVITKAITAYLTELSGLENELLIRLRADLSSADSDIELVIPSTASEAAFKTKFDDTVSQINRVITNDLSIDVTRELASFLIADVSAKVGIKVVAAIATKLGVTGGLLSTGVAAGVATFGLGLGACLLMDWIIDEALKSTGQDGVTKLSERLKASLGEIASFIKNGVPEAQFDWFELRQMAEKDPDAKVREAAAKAVDAIAKSGNLGLRHELLQMNSVRTAIRREAILNLIRGESQ